MKGAVKKRRTLDKQDATDSAQAIFAADRHGKLSERGLFLRNMRSTTGDAAAQNIANAGISDRRAAKIETWISSTDPAFAHITKESRTALILHCSITAEEFVVLSELHRTYDRALCHFMRHIISPNFARYVNALRLKAESADKDFGWQEHQKAVLEQLLDSAEPNDIIDFHQRVRDENVPCYIWIAERLSERKLLEADDVKYPELIWLNYVLYMLSNDERHLLAVPSDNTLSSYSFDVLTTAASDSDPKSFKAFKHHMVTSNLGKRILRIHRLLKADEPKEGGKENNPDESKKDKRKKSEKDRHTPKPKTTGDTTLKIIGRLISTKAK